MQPKRLMALALAAAITASAPFSVAAEENIGGGGTEGTTITQADLTDNKANASVPVNVTVSSDFTVSLPSGVTLAKTESGYGYTGEVGVKGDIGAGAAIRVSPDNTVTMHDVTYRPADATELPAQGENPEYDHKDPVSASAVQTKRLLEPADLTADAYNNTAFTMSIAELSSGKWEGQVNFDIRYIEQFVNVTATNEAGESINAYASAITGTQKATLLSSLVESGNIASTDAVDALIEVGSDDFEGLASTTFNVSGIAAEGEQVAILHFNHNNEWELIGIETVDADGTVTGDFTDYSPVAFVKVKDDGSYECIAPNCITRLLSIANESGKAYTTIDDVIADTDTIAAITSNEAAMDYLASSTDFADAVCADESFMTALGESQYTDDTVLSNDTWVSGICNSEYFELVLTTKVPIMTSNTTPSGKVFGDSSIIGSYYNDIVGYNQEYSIILNNANYYNAYRIIPLDAWDSRGYIILRNVQFYGRSLN